ncbi:Fe-S cluster assembly protein SufD [Aquiflexum lacus]|uniref:Fe-S cluster assembly protein SufD n=1 Tax=Aquiflexum lacus TaxID=2483805 RepID=UPI0018958011|nr:Fe-S cluster assembly protein SufD [Aquiflexum lacus]
MTTLTKNKISELILNQAPSFNSFPQLREKGRTITLGNGLPASKDEEYKFTSISKKLEQTLDNFSLSKKTVLDLNLIQSHLFEGFDGDLLVFNNGNYEKSLSSVNQTGIEVSSLNDSMPVSLGTIAKTEKDPFISLNNIYFEDGIFIKVKKNHKIDKPVFFLFFNKANQGQVISPRILIEVEENAEVSFLENTISLDESPYLCNVVTEIKVGQNAHVHYNRHQSENRNSIVVNNFETDIHRDATFTSVVISLSGDMVRNNLTLNLLDSGCEGNMYGLYLLNGKTHVDNHTNVDHTKPHSESNELYKGILADNSRGVFNGKIFVRQDAQKTNAFQQNNNILLSDDATVNTKPQLEIWADDVKCSHGCTTGQLDEEALFYLRARGLSKDQAKGMLLFAFAGEVLEHVSDESFKKYLTDIVQERLGSNF